MPAPRGGGAARQPELDESGRDTARSSIAAPPLQLRADPRFRHLIERLHGLGPRPTGECLLEVAAGRDLIDALEAYAALDPAAVARLEAADWPPLPIEVAA